jgi:hypothetical protein
VSTDVVEQVVTEQQNTLTSFVSLLVKEEKAQAEAKETAKDKDDKDKGKSKDPIVTDTQCKS